MERYSTTGVASGKSGSPDLSRISANTWHSSVTHERKSDSDFSNIVALCINEERMRTIRRRKRRWRRKRRRRNEERKESGSSKMQRGREEEAEGTGGRENLKGKEKTNQTMEERE